MRKDKKIALLEEEFQRKAILEELNELRATIRELKETFTRQKAESEEWLCRKISELESEVASLKKRLDYVQDKLNLYVPYSEQ